MPTPLLATKLYAPGPRPQAVVRTRLIERLTDGLAGKLTLISAPAGFGKTTLVGEWAAVCKRPVAWLSLDDGDNTPARFLTYLVAAIQTIAAGTGEALLDVIQSSQPPPIETILTVLLNEISAIETKFILVLDDFHVIDAVAVDEAITFLLEHLPPQMHLVITTRDDPRLPVARLRARGQLTELRAADLRFTLLEAVEFLNRVMRLELSEADVAALENRTEGWIAGLQLAALSMRGRDDSAEFVKAFAGDNRYIVDYLVEEVLRRQPERVRSFLLQTAILDRLNGPLCDAVTGQREGDVRLEDLERGNFFVVPLDERRHWYRYHHLFADVLRAHLAAERPDEAPLLHRRASDWYARHGSPADAIRHALAAKDYERAADLLELAVPDMRRSRQDADMLGWLRAFPEVLFSKRPVLNVHFAGILLSAGALDAVEPRLRAAERWLGGVADGVDQISAVAREDKPVVVDQEEFRRLPGQIAVYRAGLALVRGDVLATVGWSQRALELVPRDDHFLRGGAAGLLGLAYWAGGDLEAAHRWYSECLEGLRKAGNISDAIHGATVPADLLVAQGRLRDAMGTYERALQATTEHGAPVVWGTADLHVGLSELHREHNTLDVAARHLGISKELSDRTGHPHDGSRWHAAMARIREAEGDLAGALGSLYEAERLYAPGFYPNVRPVAALKARLWIAQGRVDEALAWIREQKLTSGDDLGFQHEFEYITLARVLLAQAKGDQSGTSLLDEAVGLLVRLLAAAEAGKRTGSVIEILVLLALARRAQGDGRAALAALERALVLAEPESYIRVFVDEGPAMALLLNEASKHRIAAAYVRQLLNAFAQTAEKPPITQDLVEPLSARELDVLRLLRTDLDGPDIARQLSVSLNTARSHIKNIYTKLGVNNRRAAVRRAEDLSLF